MIVQQRFLYLLPLLIFFWIPVAGCSQEGSGSYPTISPAEAAKMLEADPSTVVLDVRTAEEFGSETGHISSAILIPVGELEGRIGELDQFKSQPLLVYCRSGSRSRKASNLLSEKGFKVTMLDGGIVAWNNAGLPVEKGAKE